VGKRREIVAFCRGDDGDSDLSGMSVTMTCRQIRMDIVFVVAHCDDQDDDGDVENKIKTFLKKNGSKL
jgi:hypothetical protein